MKNKILVALAAMSLVVLSQRGFAADTNSVKFQLGELIGKVNTKLGQGKKTEKDLADELKGFDALLAKHRGEKNDDVANILMMKAMLYLQVFDDSDKGIELLKQLKRDFPETKMGQNADETIESIEKQAKAQEEAKKIKSALKEGAQFPDFNEKDLNGKSLSIANHKGKVVLVDFWATWCPPCRAELPNVIKAYEKHHAQGFEIISISLDREKAKLVNFVKDRNMTWPQYFDGEGKLATKYGVNSIPMTYLLDGTGKIIAKDLRGEDLENALTKALAKK